MRRVCAVVEASLLPGRNPILGPLAATLAERHVAFVLWDPTLSLRLPVQAPEADLYLLKADDPAALSAAGCLADSGARFLNAHDTTEQAHDHVRMLARLARAGLPVPRSSLESDRPGLAAALEVGPRFVKPLRGAHGVGAGRLGPGEADRAGAGPWLVQDVVADTDQVLKAYAVGERVACRRMRFRPGVVDAVREPVGAPEQPLVDLAVRAGEAVGLTCYGVDFVVGPDGPVIVDVNAFPGYRGVPEAAGWLADAVVAALEFGA